MLHTFEYDIFGEWDKIVKSGKKQSAWYALWAVFVGVYWGCVHGNIYNDTEAQLPPDMSKICQSMSF